QGNVKVADAPDGLNLRRFPVGWRRSAFSIRRGVRQAIFWADYAEGCRNRWFMAIGDGHRDGGGGGLGR
ncbi:MAG: hypothetical protein L0H83_14070, partial [Salinisphaera sp.]|nr:hypothetical protein [Salinisphaera sp.]